MKTPLTRLIPAVLATLAGGGCSLFLPEPIVPLPTLDYGNNESPSTLVIFLPGRGGAARDYADHGFVQQLLDCNADLAVTAADAHLGYYFAETVAERLTEDVIRPARARGVEDIWFVGTSLGALGSLIHLNDYPGTARGAVLIAPYLGEADLLEQIPADPAQTERTRSSADDDILGIWYGTIEQLKGPAPPELFLAAGTEDRFAPQHRRFAKLLPDERVYFAPGGHRWDAWEPLWAEMLPALPFCNTGHGHARAKPGSAGAKPGKTRKNTE